MEMALNPVAIVALLAGLSLISGLVIAAARAGTRSMRRLEAALCAERKAREELARDMNMVLGCSREMGERLRQQNQKQKSLSEKLNALAQQVESQQAVTQAERLFSKGLAVEQITEMCALSRGEAALLERWKQRSNAA